jgi:DNA-binding transcriptional MocR family regulator
LPEADIEIAAAAARGVGVYEVPRFYLRATPRTGLMPGSERLREAQIREGIRRLAEVL